MLSNILYNYFDWDNLKHEWLATGPKWNGTINEQAFYPYGGDFAISRGKLWNDMQPPQENDPGNNRLPKNYNRHSTVEMYISANSTFTLEAKKSQYGEESLGSLWVPLGEVKVPDRAISEEGKKVGLDGTQIYNQKLVDILSTKDPRHWVWLTDEEMVEAGVKGMVRRNYITVLDQTYMHNYENYWPQFGGPYPFPEELPSYIDPDSPYIGSFDRPVEEQYVGVSLSAPNNLFTVNPETVYWHEKYYDQTVTINVRDHVPADVTHVVLRINGYVYDGRNVKRSRNPMSAIERTNRVVPESNSNYHRISNFNIVKFIKDNPSLKQYRMFQGEDMKEQVNDRCCDVDIDAKCCLASQDKPLALPSVQQSYSCGAQAKRDDHIYYISYADFPGDTSCPILKPLGIKTHIILSDILRDLQKLVAQTELVSDDFSTPLGPWPDPTDFYLGEVRADTGRKGSDMGDQPDWSLLENFKEYEPYRWFTTQLTGVYFPYILAHHAVQRAKAEQVTKDVMAKAMFFRGYFGIELQKNFKYPPIVNRPVVEDDFLRITFTNPNNVKIWDSVISDLSYAASHLEDVQMHDGLSKMAAHAYWAKAMLYSGEVDKIKAAIPVLEPVVNSGLFTLTPKYEDNFLAAKTFNSESIFELKFWKNIFTITLSQPFTAPWGCCGFGHATQDAVDVFQTDANGLPKLDGSWKQTPFTNRTTGEVLAANSMMPIDPRLDHTLSRPGVLFKDWFPYNLGFVRSLEDMGPYRVKKQENEKDAYNNLAFGPWGTPPPNNIRRVRLAHVMLWLAEAYVEDGQLEKARALVNQLRQRASNKEGWVRKAQTKPRPADASWNYVPEFEYLEGYAHDNYKVGLYTTPWTDKAVARKAVRMETRLETTLEGNRWFDLQRWGVLDETINDYLQREQLPQYTGVVYTDEYEYLNLNKFYTVNPDLSVSPPVDPNSRRKLSKSATHKIDPRQISSMSGLHNVDPFDPVPAQLFNKLKQ